MRMNRNPVLEIPKPCHEKWEEMGVVDETRRSCEVCSRVIVDFSKMSDADLIRYISSNERICGRFTEQQLNRPIIGEQKRYGLFRLRNLFTLPFLLFGASLIAKNKSENSITAVALQEHNNVALPELKTENGTFDSTHVKGVVRDSISGETMPFVIIMVVHGKDTTHAQTDVDGNFAVPVPDLKMGDSLHITAMYLGYKRRATDLLYDGTMVIVNMDQEEVHMMGELIITDPHPAKKKRGR